MTSNYYYMLPGSFDLVGFAYGKSEGAVSRGGKIKAKLVPSGRWATEEPQGVELVHAGIEARVESEAEALDGVGTFVGGASCTSRVSHGGPRVWDYGLVVGYRWESEERNGVLAVSFGEQQTAILHSPYSIFDVAVEIYSLRPCSYRGVGLVMPLELKQMHDTVYKMFNGVVQSAVRVSAVLLAAVGDRRLDESKTVPLLDISSFEVTQVTIRHILKYVFYKDGGRFPPLGMVFGDSIFDPVPVGSEGHDTGRHGVTSPMTRTEVVQNDGLSDSDDDVVDPDDVIQSPTEPATKRRRAKRQLQGVYYLQTNARSLVLCNCNTISMNFYHCGEVATLSKTQHYAT
ncbi:hypothetical protein PC129_g20774 [Phytophthora cactorum]|uniref:Uncharacterized protein n=1 Tax=Phytophthora cactorum TaxID=29920 RepID=A0A329RQQ8_9STRA|nr:hypothetical protein Pcac1_g27871 [Phytophthora cactorum]KAG2798354.1 hypothetical protein PC112_g21389 [Phytophthora cactorum]KAG2798391.1 hypothetical protein PC111_g20876 [Phytophthora cactorum]KAG2829274.1 hypothetical protein PC113_g21313 [Phytophthora cactorum]KAG2877375.1 hypothetical protein PC114_g23671 [Phytophthora cactorum]